MGKKEQIKQYHQINQPFFAERYEEIANKIALSLDIQNGEHVLLVGAIHHFELLERISFYVMKMGGFPKVSIQSDELSRKMLLELPETYLDRQVTQHDRYMASLYDASFYIDKTIDEQIFSDIPPEKMKLGTARRKELSDIATSRKSRKIYAAWPTPQKAASCGFETRDFEQLFLDAFMIDIPKMTKQGEEIRSRLMVGGNIEIISPDAEASRLTFKLDAARRVMIDTGSYTKEMIVRGDITKNLPCGEVYTTAIEETVEGEAYFSYVISDGAPIKGLKLQFKQGKLVNVTAKEGVEHFFHRYDAATGDKDRIGELGIGINPVLSKPIGHSLMDEKIFGSIHLALGENRMYGGNNKATMHWDLVMLQPSLFLNTKPIIEKGEFVYNKN